MENVIKYTLKQVVHICLNKLSQTKLEMYDNLMCTTFVMYMITGSEKSFSHATLCCQ